MKYIKSPPVIELSSKLSILMLDALHDGLGNKFYKLQLNLDEAKRLGHSTLVSFGGAWSNHIHTLARIGSEQGFRTVGIIRGEEHGTFSTNKLSAMLEDADSWGMDLEFVSRSAYRQKDSPALMKYLKEEYGQFYLIPEGGSNALAVKGCRQIVEDLHACTRDYDLLVLPVGTGGTIAGVVSGLDGKSQVLGISVLKGGAFLTDDVKGLLREVGCTHQNWFINLDFHCGGYARYPDYLRDFIQAFECETSIELDPVYTGKMMYAIDQLRGSGEINGHKKVIAIHTGGLQGKRGFPHP